MDENGQNIKIIALGVSLLKCQHVKPTVSHLHKAFLLQTNRVSDQAIWLISWLLTFKNISVTWESFIYDFGIEAINQSYSAA